MFVNCGHNANGVITNHLYLQNCRCADWVAFVLPASFFIEAHTHARHTKWSDDDDDNDANNNNFNIFGRAQKGMNCQYRIRNWTFRRSRAHIFDDIGKL